MSLDGTDASSELSAASPRGRILAAATELLERGGRDAISTRAVSVAAGVQAPTLYRLFGDKQGLLQAVASNGVARYLASKRSQALSGDPVEDLRRGWDLHLGLALDNPALYLLIHEGAGVSDPTSPVHALIGVLAEHVRRVAQAGRLVVTEQRAVNLLHAAGRGAALTLIDAAPADRDPGLSVATRDAVIAVIADGGRRIGPVDGHEGTAVQAAVTLRALLPGHDAFTAAEEALLQEWLDRLATAST